MRVRAWYGLAGEIDVAGPRWHVVRVAGVPLGHPPLVNLALRRGLAADERARLSGLHELGHLQTLALAHGLALLWMGGRRHRARGRRLGWVTAALVAHHAVWELASEAYVVLREGVAYRTRYRTRPNRLVPLFWVVTAGLGLGLSWWLIGARRGLPVRAHPRPASLGDGGRLGAAALNKSRWTSLPPP